MSWLSGRSKKKVKLEWEFEAKGVIWRLLPTTNGCFIGEDRTMEEKRTSFFCVDQRSGKVLWKDVSFTEPWWISIEATHEDVVFLHEYATPDMPEHKKIIAASLSTGAILWTNDTMKFEFASGGFVYASCETYDSRIFSELNLGDGLLNRELDVEHFETLRNTAETFSDSHIEFPMTFDLEADSSSEVTVILEKAAARFHAIGQMEYLEKNGMLIIAYYNKVKADSGEQLLQQHLVVMGKEKSDILYKDVMSKQMNAVVPDLFFAKGELAYYIKEKKNLTAMRMAAEK